MCVAQYLYMQTASAVHMAVVMQTQESRFALRPRNRDSRRVRRISATLLKVAMLVISLTIYWGWNHHAQAAGLIFPRERKLATANAVCLLNALGLAKSLQLRWFV